MINVTLTLHDALEVLKSNDLPSILRIQIADNIRDDITLIHSDFGKARNRVEYLEAEIRGVIELLESYRSDDRLIIKNDLETQIAHLRNVL